MSASSEESVDDDPAAGRLALYVPRLLQERSGVDAFATPDSWTADGTAAFIDVAGFTRLSEQLASKGREGAEQIAETIGRCFGSLLGVAYDAGATLLKFGGDALLLWFRDEDHLQRACHATLAMRDDLERVGRIALPGAEVTLRMSQGVHTGSFPFIAAGTSHVELLTSGPGWTRLVAMERAADAGEILLSPETAAGLPVSCLGAAKGPGVLLATMPGAATPPPPLPGVRISADALARCLSPAVRAHVQAGGVASEHRPVSVAFLRYGGIDDLIAASGLTAAAAALHRLLHAVDSAVEGLDVALLGSDLDADGGKLILCAGAPKVTGDDEERLLLAARRIIDAEVGLDVRIGVHRGAVFAGDIGPDYRRTYTVMGDVVNLAARVMAKAAPGQVLATAEVIERSNTLFEQTELDPFQVKGKAEPVHAWSIGRAVGSRMRHSADERLPLTGRNPELAVVRKALAAARAGVGQPVEIVGEAGIGKTRLLEAMRDAAMGFRKLRAACEAYTSSSPYAVWQELLRETLELGREATDDVAEAALRQAVAAHAPDLERWLALLGAPLGLVIAPSAEADMLAEDNRRSRLHETVERFLAAMLPGPALIEIDDAHHMDEASVELTRHLVQALPAHKWVLGIARRPDGSGGTAGSVPVQRVELKPLARNDALRLVQLATKEQPLPAHVVEVVAQRSGGHPQFLRDLVRSAAASGGVVGLPDSAEAAALARIDALPPAERGVVRRASVFGLTFHPRMLAWFDDPEDGPPPDTGIWARLADLFEDDGDGYLRFRQSLLRDTAYEGLPFRQRRRLHATVALHVEQEMDNADDVAGALSLHYQIAGDFAQSWRYACLAGKCAEDVYAYVEAATLYGRALEAGRQMAELPARELAAIHEALADAWYRAGEYRKSSEAYAGVRKRVKGDKLAEAGLLLKLSWVEEKLGNYPEALRWTDRARDALAGLHDPEAGRMMARTTAWYATVLQAQGRSADALDWASRAAGEAAAVDDPEEIGNACAVMGWATGAMGREGAEAMLLEAVEAFGRSGNRVRRALILSNVGGVCYWDGRWDDAMGYYERSRDESIKVGNAVNAATASMNIAEILTDRGEHAESEATLQKTMAVWKSSEYRYFHGACLWMLGRVSLRANRIDEAIARFGEARKLLVEVGADDEVQDVDARVAECRMLERDAAGALALVTEILSRPQSPQAIERLTPHLLRVRGYAQLVDSEPFGAREAFDASLEAARARNDRYEIALTLNALVELDRLEGVEAPPEIIDESRSIMASFKVRALPPVPAIAA